MKGLGKENNPIPVAPPAPAPAKKDRHIVSWTAQEDDLLREHIALHGTDNWTSIAALFKDKTSRQCRRRWYTYLNSECKKGGWSAEEDMLLCEAQKIFGNRWTEIAKVVSGRTDNAVKNRFSTLCKKRAKIESSSKENKMPSFDPSNKRILVQDGYTGALSGESSISNKHMRYHISHPKEATEKHKKILGEHGPEQNQPRPPLAVLVQNFANVSGLSNNKGEPLYDASKKVSQATFLKRDDPKLTALLQQAELLTSLSKKVNSENTNQSLDEAWKELQDYLIQTEDSGFLGRKFSGMDSMLDELRDLIEDLHNSKEGQQSLRQVDCHEDSQGSSECITVSTHNMNADLSGSNGQYENCSLPKSNEVEDSSLQNDDEVNYLNDDATCSSMNASPEAILPLSGMLKDEVENGGTNSEFASPLQTIPPFQSFSEDFPTPVFTSSERHFLLSLLDFSSPESNTNSSKLPSCKRSLLDIYKPS
ncbi:transcription factor MYB80-like [Canna indica]|uniref:Transcription factor MYB80-like n=1 Tax=Canna indica TaxID=4628 RepID=A0AAQ3Q867_9LILI|nr:transcription factor MYB80-like [Canna indica]